MNNPLEAYFPEVVAQVKGFAIFMIDKDATILTWNRGCELMKGYSADEAIGQNFNILFPEFLREKGFPEEEVKQAAEKGRYETENWRRKKNGELFWACVLLTRINDEQGKLIGFVKITQDHTHRKRFEDELNSKVEDIKNINYRLNVLNEELLASNSSLKQFAYVSSHDLQAPLRKISVFVDRLKERLQDKVNDIELDLLERVEASTARMAKLIDDLLVYSNVTQGPGLLTDIKLTGLIYEVLDDLELDISEKNAVISIGELPTVKGNSRQFQQLFQNLISNALKYAKHNQAPTIEVFSTEVLGSDTNTPIQGLEPDKKYHLLEVRDNGIGFDEEFGEEIFKVFTRLHSASDVPGTGIGLSIVKKVVQNHNGFIWAESKPQEGSSFKLILPAKY